jgi:cellulose synthase (UDP-forming)
MAALHERNLNRDSGGGRCSPVIEIDERRRATYLLTCRVLAILSALSALVYLKWLLFDAKPENWLLFVVLVTAELFNITQAAGFWYTISTQRWTEPRPVDFSRTHERVDIFITVCGEPIEIVRETLEAAMAIRHPRKEVWVLDDGNSRDVGALALLQGAGHLTRPTRRGAKAGNINEALARTNGHFVVIFDADHVPKPDFLEKTMGVFLNRRVAFVQTPQSYYNRDVNRVAAGAHDQQELFYGPIMRGRNSCRGVFACGTNLIFRRSALEVIGGLPEDSITEDLRVSLMLLRAGYDSEYVSKVLAHGIGPVDVSGYFSQQLRWARGGLEILFRRRPFFKGMGLPTRFQYALSFIYWFTGPAFALYLTLPAAFLFLGVRPVHAPNQYPAYFLPYIVLTLITMIYASNRKIRFRTLWYTLASFPVHVTAFFSALFGKDAKFVVTSKHGATRSLRPVLVQVVTISVLLVAIATGLVREGFTPAVLNNVAFAIGHILVMQGFVRYALWPEQPETGQAEDMTDEKDEVASQSGPFMATSA